MLSAYISQRTSNDSKSVFKSFQVFGLNYIFSIILSPGSLGIGIFWHIKTHGCGCHPNNPSSQGAVVEGIFLLHQNLLHFIGLMFVIPEPLDLYEIMQEHVEQREDGEVKRPRFHLEICI